MSEPRTLTASRVLLLAAIILFILSGFGVSIGQLTPLPFGLACFAAAFLL